MVLRERAVLWGNGERTWERDLWREGMCEREITRGRDVLEREILRERESNVWEREILGEVLNFKFTLSFLSLFLRLFIFPSIFKRLLSLEKSLSFRFPHALDNFWQPWLIEKIFEDSFHWANLSCRARWMILLKTVWVPPLFVWNIYENVCCGLQTLGPTMTRLGGLLMWTLAWVD